MSFSLKFDVRGVTPAPKGSYKTYRTRTGKPVLQPASRREKPWRAAVALYGRQALAGQNPPPRGQALAARIRFRLQRGRTVTRQHPTTPPDLDKLVRATLDGLVDGGIITDDSQIVRLEAEKTYVADPATRGAAITLKEIPSD